MGEQLTGKTALVTGGSRGIGRAVALKLAAEGALVAVHYGANEAAALETVARIGDAGGRAFPVQARFGGAGAEYAACVLLAASTTAGRPLWQRHRTAALEALAAA